MCGSRLMSPTASLRRFDTAELAVLLRSAAAARPARSLALAAVTLNTTERARPRMLFRLRRAPRRSHVAVLLHEDPDDEALIELPPSPPPPCPCMARNFTEPPPPPPPCNKGAPPPSPPPLPWPDCGCADAPVLRVVEP